MTNTDRFRFRSMNPNDTSARPPTNSKNTTATINTASSVPAPSTALSTVAEAGIGVGAAVSGLALIALAVFFIRRHRRKSKRAGIMQLDSRERGGLGELQGKEQYPELHAQEYHCEELDNTERSQIYELDGGS